MSTPDIRLGFAISSLIEERLGEVTDRFLRVDLPCEWPVSEAIESMDLSGVLQLGVMRPFRVNQFSAFLGVKDCAVTDKANEMTRWRDPLEGSTSTTVLFGAATGEAEAGLRDLDEAAIITEAQVITRWLANLHGCFADRNAQASETSQEILGIMGSHPPYELTPRDMDEFVSTLDSTEGVNELLSEQREALWRLHLIPDGELHNGEGDARLQVNAEIVDRLRRSNPSDKLQRDLNETGGEVAKALLEYANGRPAQKDLLRGLELSDVLEVIKPSRGRAGGGGGGGGRGKVKEIGLFDALDKLRPMGRKAMLDSFCDQFSQCYDDEAIELSYDPRPGELFEGEKVPVRVLHGIRASHHLKPENKKEPWRCPWTQGGVHEHVVQKRYLTAPPDSRYDIFEGKEAQEWKVDQLLEAVDDVEAHGVILALLSARGKLGAYSRWLSTAQFEAVLLSREIRAAVEDYERAWDAVLCLINDADVELLNEVKSIARLDTAFYQPEDQKEEARVRLGYLHPYSLLPNLDLARYLLQNCGDNTSDLGDRLEWAVDHGLTPLARVLHFVGISDDPKDEDLLVLHYKGSRSPFKGATPALVEFGPIGDQSNVEKADRGSGLKEAYEGLKVVHPYVGAGLRILLINAPFGKAVQANLSGILRDLQSLAPDSVLSVEYALVGNKDHELIIDDQSVTGASAGISWKVLGRFSSIEEVLEVAHPAHLSLYFSPTFSGSKVLTVDQVGACEFDVVKAAYGDAYTVKIKHAPHRSALFKGMTRLSGNGAIIAQLDVGDSTETLRGYLSAMKGHSAMKAHSEWVGVASSNVLATPLPRPSVDDGVLGRASIGPYSIHLEYCDGAPLSPILAPITERGPWLLEDSSVLNRLGERLLRVLRTESMTEEIALGVSISLAERALRECGYEEVYEINVDDLSWSRPWLASWEGPDSGTKEERERGRRCDRIFVGLRDLEPEAPTACILFVESKGNYQDVGVSFSPASEPWKKAVTQVEQTYSSLMSLIDERCGVKLNLLDQLRREHFAKHLSSVVIEGHSPPTNDEEKSRYERKYKVLNMLLSGTIPPDSLEVGTLCVLARPKDSTPTGSDQCDVPVSAGAPPLKFVRCERDSLDEDEPLSFVQEVSVGLLAPLIDIDPRCCGGDAEPPPVESVERGGSENVGETPAPASVGAESLGSEGHAGEVVETPRVERGDFVVVIQSDGGVRFTGGGAPEYEVERLERAQVYKTLGGAERWVAKKAYGDSAEVLPLDEAEARYGDLDAGKEEEGAAGRAAAQPAVETDEQPGGSDALAGAKDPAALRVSGRFERLAEMVAGVKPSVELAESGDDDACEEVRGIMKSVKGQAQKIRKELLNLGELHVEEPSPALGGEALDERATPASPLEPAPEEEPAPATPPEARAVSAGDGLVVEGEGAPAVDELPTAAPEEGASAAAAEERPARNGLSLELGVDPSGALVRWEPEKEEPKLTNAHMVILGSSGAGKTQTLKSFMHGLSERGVPTIVLDFKEDYTSPEFLQQVGAQLYEAEDGLPINPLAAAPGQDGRVRIMKQAYAVSGALKEIFGLGPQQEANLKNAIKSAYRDEGIELRQKDMPASGRFPGFDDILPHLEESGDVALLNRLSPIFDLGLFARQEGTLAELLRESTVVRLGQLPNDRVKKAAAEFLLFDIYSHLLASGHTQQTRFVLLIDEAHRIANLEAMKLLLREARAFGCAVLLSSQTAVDFDDLIYANAGTVLSMRLSDAQSAKAAAKHVCDAEGDQKGVAEQLRSLETFHGALRNSHYPGPTWLRLTPFFERIAAHES